MSGPRLSVEVAGRAEREEIYRLRHDVYARELGQYAENEERRLMDLLDEVNVYLVVKDGEEILGHVSVTPPGAHGYSLDKYLRREDLPFPVDAKSYEVRLLTVRDARRGGPTALLLLLAALKWIQRRGGTRIIAIGRRQVMPFYVKAGLAAVGLGVKSGAVDYEVMTATTEHLASVLLARKAVFERAEREACWRLEPGDA